MTDKVIGAAEFLAACSPQPEPPKRQRFQVNRFLEERGFGFGIPYPAGGQSVFLHVKNIRNRRGRTPAEGDFFTASVVKEAKGLVAIEVDLL